MQRPTKTERQEIRQVVLDVMGATAIEIGRNLDDTWFCDVYGLVIEAGSAGDVLRALADVLEES